MAISLPSHDRSNMMLIVLSLLWTTTTPFVAVDAFRSSVLLDRSHQHCTGSKRLSTSLFHLTHPTSSRVYLSSSTLSSTTSTRIDTSSSSSLSSPKLKSTLKKPSKVLTVGIEYDPQSNHHDKNEASMLSMQLRKSKVSSIWCHHLEHVQDFSEEQASAQGNFPGPVPIIFHGPLKDVHQLQEVVNAGAAAVVASLKDDRAVLEAWIDEGNSGVEFVWKISTVEDAQQVLDLTGNAADAFRLTTKDDDTSLLEEIVASLPKSSLFILPLDPMQPDGAEVTRGKEWKQLLGCPSVVVRKACVGDAEDIMYSQFLVNGLTSKASSEFKFTGLTGSTNGHFGGVQAKNKVQWRRME